MDYTYKLYENEVEKILLPQYANLGEDEMIIRQDPEPCKFSKIVRARGNVPHGHVSEVLRMGDLRKFAIDFDAKGANRDEAWFFIEHVLLGTIVCEIKRWMPADELLFDTDCVVVERKNPAKVSFHIIVDGVAMNTPTAKAIWASIHKRILTAPKWAKWAAALDSSKSAPYSLSMAGTTKDGYKLEIITEHTWEQSLIGTTKGCTVIDIPQGAKEVERPIAEAQEFIDVSKQIPDIENWIAGAFNGSVLNFKRIRPSKCRICECVHEKENSLYVFVTKSGFYEGCLRSKIYKPEHRGILLKKFDWIARFVANHKPQPESKQIEMPPLPYEAQNIKAGMGTGKTREIIKLIQQVKRALVISTRRSFTDSLMARAPFMTDYRKSTGKIDMKVEKVILQVESLHRLDWTEMDLLVIDEAESVMSQLLSPNVQNKKLTFDVFQHMMRIAKKTITMDANLTEDTVQFFESAGMPVARWNIIPQAGRKATHHIYAKDSLWDQQLKDELIKGSNVAILYLGSVENAASLKQQCEKILREQCDCKDPNVLLLTSATDEKIKTAFYNQPSEVDVLIYSPTVGAGTDITYLTPEGVPRAHFDCLFARLNNHTANWLEVRQMMRRVRHFRRPDTYIHFECSQHDKLPLTQAALMEHYNNRAYVFTGDVEYRNGKQIIHPTTYNNLWIKNTLRTNKSKQNFTQLFLEGEVQANPSLEFQYYTEKSEAGKKMKREMKVAAELIKKDEEYAVANAKDITWSAALDLQKKSNLTQDEKRSLKKHHLTESLNVRITPELLSVFDAPTRKVYYNCKKRADTVEQRLDAALNGAGIEGEQDYEVIDIIARNNRVKRILANKVVDTLGIEFGAAKTWTRLALEKRIDTLDEKLLESIRIEYHNKKSENGTFKSKLANVNSALSTYGFTVSATDKHNKTFKLSWILQDLVVKPNEASWNGKFERPVLS